MINENMTKNMHVGDIVSIWDSNDDQRVQIGVGQCKDPSLVLIGTSGMENYIIVTIVLWLRSLSNEDSFAQLDYLVKTMLFVHLHHLKALTLIRKLTIGWMVLPKMSPMDTSVILFMILTMVALWKEVFLILWMKGGMRKEMAKKSRTRW